MQQQGDIGECPGAVVKLLEQRIGRERRFNAGASSGQLETGLSWRPSGVTRPSHTAALAGTRMQAGFESSPRLSVQD